MNFARSEDRQNSKLVDAARSIIAESFPNPDRIDCPDQNLREAVALRKVKLKQHWDVLEHVITCSPCFAEHMAVRRRLRRRSVGVKLSVMVFVALCAGYATWREYNQPVERLTTEELRQGIKLLPGVLESEPRVQTVLARLDFSAWSATRDPGSQTTTLPPPVLWRGRLSLTIQLPLLSPPGMYSVALTSTEGASLFRQSVRASVTDGATTLQVMNVDTTTAKPGIYDLTVLRQGTSASRRFPVRIE